MARGYEPAKATGSCGCLTSRGRSGDVLEPVRGSVAATRLSKYYQGRAALLGGDMSIEDFEAKWRDVRIDGRKVFADANAILRMADAGILDLDNLYSNGGPEK